jgi:hypothetical protein
MIKPNTYLYITDPGHGWLQVPVEHVIMLGIDKDITPFSYRWHGMAYLEEDLDMATFCRKYKERFGVLPTIKDTHTNSESPIRRMEHWS